MKPILIELSTATACGETSRDPLDLSTIPSADGIERRGAAVKSPPANEDGDRRNCGQRQLLPPTPRDAYESKCSHPSAIPDDLVSA